ncbi:RNA-binding protein, putative [Babesia caballi]|uniref:RNA-binding protein, putative n=1 Tax=Babesia caballi TaxID=5871 RepID=A0AAV4LQS1_BABCB|nr:RNA-binding protein, putative [Babesia caballi]
MRGNGDAVAFVGFPSPAKQRTTRILGAGRFTFDPELVKKRRRRPLAQRSDKAKKKWEDDHAAMHELANLSSDHPKKEDLRAISLKEFITRIESKPQRKRLPQPAECHEPSYDAVLYLKGLPFEVNEEDIFRWLEAYDVVYVVLIKNERGEFTGDAYVRCGSVAERDRVHREMSDKYLGVRYIQMYRMTEAAYTEYYHTGFRREPARRNHVSPSYLVVKQGSQITPSEVGSLKTGSRICGAVTHIYRNGLLVDCGVYESIGDMRERVFCVLMRNRIARNIGLMGQQKEWLRTKDLVLFPGIKLNLYVEKIRKTTAQSSFDEDLWREHFGEPFESLNADSEASKRSLVYLTMDSSVSEDKVRWWERRLVDSYAMFSLKDGKVPESVEDEEVFQRVAVSAEWLGGRPDVQPKAVMAGKVVIAGNEKHPEHTSTFALETMDSDPLEDKDSQPYHDLVCEFLRGSDVDSHGTRYHGFDEIGGYREPDADVSRRAESPMVLGDSAVPENDMELYNISTDHSAAGNDFVAEKTAADERIKVPHKSSIQGTEVSVGRTNGFSAHLKSAEPTSDLSTLNNVMDEVRRRTIEEEMKVFPRTSLFDECIQLPVGGWLLRRSDVPKLSELHVIALLRQLGKEPVESGENPDFENRLLLCQVIKERGLGTGLDPQTLISKGVYKVKQSKKKLKRIIELTKHLTGRRFTREDLDAAPKSELQMLAEESLRKFAEWDPSDDVKRVFVSMYGGDLSEEREGAGVAELWHALKWRVVLEAYGEQSDLKEIINDIENNDRMFGCKPGSSAEALEHLVHGSLRNAAKN